MQVLLKTSRTDDAIPVEESTGNQVLARQRHEGRKLIEVFLLTANGDIDRFQERTRRRLGSNAITSRTWLCETEQDGGWINGRYIPEPADAIKDADAPPQAVVLVLAGAEGTPETVVEQLRGIATAAAS